MCKDKHFFLYFIFCEHFLAFSSLFLKFNLSSFMFNLSANVSASVRLARFSLSLWQKV